MILMVLHPTTNTLVAGLAQVGMHLAVVAPILWVPDYFLGDYKRLARLLTILWILNGSSAIVGVLQVRDPNTWLPTEFSSVETKNKSRISALSYRSSDNQLVVRPPGLGDTPGAACGAGMFVASVGIAFIGLPTSNWRKIIGLGMAVLGISVIFLTHVRSALLVLAGSAIVFTAVMAAQKRFATALVLVGAMASCGLCSYIYASAVGGRQTIDRFGTLLEDDPTTVLERSGRLGMTTNALDTLIFEYPFGAGLGRWGMMRNYFGNEGNLDSPPIWAEVQLASWALDGGVILLSLYLFAIATAVHRLIRLSLVGHPDLLRRWGAVVLMLSLAPVALIFSWTPFNAQTGIQFWLLIGAFEGVAQGEENGRVSGLIIRDGS